RDRAGREMVAQPTLPGRRVLRSEGAGPRLVVPPSAELAPPAVPVAPRRAASRAARAWAARCFLVSLPAALAALWSMISSCTSMTNALSVSRMSEGLRFWLIIEIGRAHV